MLMTLFLGRFLRWQLILIVFLPHAGIQGYKLVSQLLIEFAFVRVHFVPLQEEVIGKLLNFLLVYLSIHRPQTPFGIIMSSMVPELSGFLLVYLLHAFFYLGRTKGRSTLCRRIPCHFYHFDLV